MNLERKLAASPDAPVRRGQARGLSAEECAAVLTIYLRPRRVGRGHERPETAERRGLIDVAIGALLLHGGYAVPRRRLSARLMWRSMGR